MSLSRFSACLAVLAGSLVQAADSEPASKAISALRNLPVRFEPNKGQWDAPVRFSATAGDYRVSLTPREAIVSLSRGAGQSPARVRVSLPGSRAPRSIEGIDPLPSTSNYFLGNRKAQWRTGVPHYGRVRYGEVYPGVDLIYYGSGRQLEFDFVVRPGADPRRIRMKFRGAERLALTPEGDLRLEANGVTLSQRKPQVYQDGAGGRREIPARYRLAARGEVAIELGDYDRSRALTIDPVLAYSSLLGGAGPDAVTCLKVDPSGMVWVAGYMQGSEIPGTDNAYQQTPRGGTDIFVAKIDPAASGQSSLLYLTYFGGSGTDIPRAMAIDPAGNVYLTGSTDSLDFPLAGATVSQSTGAGTDAFVVKLVPSLPGSDSLFYSSYLGGSGLDIGYDIAVDGAGAVYVIGTTRSENFPVTDSGYQRIRWGNQDAFIAKLVPGSSSPLVYSTYLGGEVDDDGRSIAVTPSGAVYIAGTTSSSQFPYAGNPYRTTPAGGVDVFVAQMDLTKSGESSLVYSSYFGGSGLEEARKIAVDGSGRAILTGYTLSTDLPVTPGAYQTALAGNADVFVARLNLSAPPDSFVEYATYLGGSGGDVAYDLALDGSTVVLTGYTLSKDFPVTEGAVQPDYGGGVDVFVARLDLAAPGPRALLLSTYLGYGGINTGNAVAATSDGTVYVGGMTATKTIPVTGNGAQTGYGGSLSDGFVLVLKP